jgi:hypothetical protein
MADSGEDRQFRSQLERIESLLQKVEHFPDPGAREQTKALIRSILDVHAAGLERLFTKISDSDKAGNELIDWLAEDDLVAGMLLLYGLHPLDLTERVEQALARLQSDMRSRGYNVELLNITDGVVLLKLDGTSRDNQSASAVQQRIESVIYAAAPDVAAVQYEGWVQTEAEKSRRLRPLPLLNG